MGKGARGRLSQGVAICWLNAVILDDDDAFDRWNNEIKAKIKSKLLDSAGGMFVLS